MSRGVSSANNTILKSYQRSPIFFPEYVNVMLLNHAMNIAEYIKHSCAIFRILFDSYITVIMMMHVVDTQIHSYLHTLHYLQCNYISADIKLIIIIMANKI